MTETSTQTLEKLPQTSLVLLKEEGSLILAMKKRGFGAGKWNGYGGKPKKHESVRQSAFRETKEEALIILNSIGKVAVLNFYFPEDKKSQNQQVHVYVCDEWTGTPQETYEMRPRKFAEADIPYEVMWSDDIYWLPRVLDGEIIEADFYFDDNDQVTKHVIRPLTS